MQLLLWRPFHPADAREPSASWPLTVFVMIAWGFVTSELTTEWESARRIFVWVGFLPLALDDPLGINTAAAIASKSLSPPAPWLSLPAVSALGIVLISLGIMFAVHEARMAHPQTYRQQLFSKFALATVFAAIVVGWGL